MGYIMRFIRNSLITMVLMTIAFPAVSGRRQEGIVIFVSFSIPDASLKEILNDAAKINAPVVIRGLVDHSFQKTVDKIYTITHDNHHSLQIDPELFTQYHIEKVPAVLVNAGNDYQIIYGNVVLHDQLSILAKGNDGIAKIAREALQKL